MFSPISTIKPRDVAPGPTRAVRQPAPYMRRHPAIVLRSLALLLFAMAPPAAGATLASHGDASISHDSNGNWTLAAGGAVLSLAADASRDFTIVKLTSASG